ncbi:MAG TPA: lipopolysaccharide biosynthesis protein [Steroidobacteraceae bacterium]|nr:lipopolysaccharide biosynthesis protein [Steroidobacteraceae bacterium]
MTEETTEGGAPRGGAVQGGSVDLKMAKGAIWMVLARFLDRTIALASTVILARLLVPADFGLVAMATAILAVLELFVSLGFDVALIRNREATREHYDTAWTMNVLLGTGIAIAMLLVAGPVTEFYTEPRLAAVIQVLALGAFVQGFENIGVVSFRKDLRFRQDFNLMFYKKLGTFLIAIPLALILRNYWALVAGTVAARLLNVGLTYLMHSYRPRFSLAARGELFHFGKWLIVGNAVYFAGTRSADFIVGKVSGAHQLGIFNIAYETSNLPTSDLIAPINRAIYPGYAQKAHDLGLLRRSYLEVIGLVALLAIPAGAGIAATAKLIVPLVLGPNWLEAIPVMEVLAVYGVFLALKSNNHYIYLSMGTPRTATILGIVQTSLLVPLAIVGSIYGGAIGTALGYLLAQVLFTPLSVTFLRRALKLPMRELTRVFYRPFVAGGLMYLVVRLLASKWAGGLHSSAALVLPTLACVALGVVLYCTAIYILWRIAGRPDGAERRALAFVEPRLPARIRTVMGSWPMGAKSGDN